jgi:hypothetical protein
MSEVWSAAIRLRAKRAEEEWAADVVAASYYVVPAGHYEARILQSSAIVRVREET